MLHFAARRNLMCKSCFCCILSSIQQVVNQSVSTGVQVDMGKCLKTKTKANAHEIYGHLIHHEPNRRKTTCFVALKMSVVLGLESLKLGFSAVLSAAKTSSLLADKSWIRKPDDEDEIIE